MSTHRPDAGFSLAAVIFFLTAVSIFIAAVVPAYQTQAKREMEEELIFRGEEYTRAIQKYQRRFTVAPSSIDQLLSTNGIRFLRRPYKDPITGKEFRLITINPDGTLSGSKMFTQNPNTQPLFGNTQGFGQQQNPQQTQPGVQGAQQQMQQPQNSQQTFRQGQQPGSPMAGNQQPGFQAVGSASTPGTTFSGQQQQGFGFPPQGQQRSQQLGGSQITASGIVGVASDSSKESIKVYNNRQKYDEWEFIAIFGQSNQPNRNQGSNPAGTSQTGANPNVPNPAAQNPRGFNQPFQSPFGTNPIQSPFGGTTQQQQAQPRK